MGLHAAVGEDSYLQNQNDKCYANVIVYGGTHVICIMILMWSRVQVNHGVHDTRGLSFSLEVGSQIYWGVINFWKEK